ncbi:hypothetical protein [Lacticigenium naphthae]|uniref:hypothetical protein n=1 Tax=Lacticigenium naphthae TaxID=515351 RepID=UPI00041AF955|nr:hypothetical protein [Lacticigenium naphthae]
MYYRLNEMNKEVRAFKFIVDGLDLVIQTTDSFNESELSPMEFFMMDYDMVLDQFGIYDREYFG